LLKSLPPLKELPDQAPLRRGSMLVQIRAKAL